MPITLSTAIKYMQIDFLKKKKEEKPTKFQKISRALNYLHFPAYVKYTYAC